ncbi:Calx-beta domain-containing protein [Gimesia alba]|nr:Calx-beta domain-containing protein [Gimesia alba]
MVTRFDLDRYGNPSVSEYNNYELLANDSDLGLRDDSNNGIPDLAYVTGTGAHDQIALTNTGTDTVTVTIKAYSDEARTTQIGSTFSYTIDLTSDTDGEILIDAGIGVDEIVIDATIDASFRIRGGGGADTFRLSGSPDVLTGVFSDSGIFSYEFTNSASQRTIEFVEIENLYDETVLADKSFDSGTLNDSWLLTNSAVSGSSALQFSLYQTVHFVNPTGTLDLDLGTGNDSLEISGLDAGFGGALIVSGNTGSDQVTVSNSFSAGAITLTAELIELDAVTITTTSDQTYNGAVTLTGNTTISAEDVYFQDSIDSTSSSNLVVYASGGSATAVSSTGSLVKDGTGTLSIQGSTNFNSTSFNNGILIQGDDYKRIIDDDDPGFSKSVGHWTYLSQNIYHGDDTYYLSSGTYSGVMASWSFSALPAGTYRISGQWYAETDRATNTSVTVSGIVGGDDTQTIDQRYLSADVTDGGFDWQDLGYYIVDGSGTITVTMTNDMPDGYVIADAMRIERVNSAVSVSDVSVDEGAGTVTVTVTSSLPAGGAFSVDYATANGTATAGSDYTSTSGTLNFAGTTAGETQTFTVNITDDGTQESLETFLVNLSNLVASGSVTLSDDQATVSITDNDTPSLSVSDISVNESAGTVTVTVTASLAAGGAYSIDYATANGTATAGSDYTSTSGTLNFTGTTANETQTFTVTISDDSTEESNETFLVNLSNLQASGLTVVVGDDQGVVTILNDDYKRIIDDGDTGFTKSASGWTQATDSAFYGGDIEYMNSGSNPGVYAAWAFSGLVAGTYRISGHWYVDAYRATDSTFTVSGVVGGPDTVPLDQTTALSADVTDGGFDWQDLGYYVVDGSGTITVTLTNADADGYVEADAMRLELVTLAPLVAVGGQSSSTALSITQDDLDSVRHAALSYWESSGLTEAQIDLLQSVNFVLSDLPDAMLGGATGATVIIDINAAGYGWFVDETPFDNSEFSLDTNGNLVAGEGSAAFGRMDLLTVVMHELGHILGHDHEEESSLMDEALNNSQRRLPEIDEFFSSVVNGENPLLD